MKEGGKKVVKMRGGTSDIGGDNEKKRTVQGESGGKGGIQGRGS